MNVAIGIDLGGTKIAGGVVAADGSVLARSVIRTETRNETTLISGVAKVVQELRATAPAVGRVGIGAAGLIDVAAGVIVTSPNLPTSDLGLAGVIASRTGLEVFLDNDANAAAFAEARVGAARGAGTSVTITVGTGIGGGIVVDGALLRGARGFAGEVGHLVVDRSGPACACGARGCLEALASGSALARTARERLSEPDAAAFRAAVEAGEDCSGELVGRFAVEGDSWARGLVAQAGASLGLGLASLSNVLDPDRFVVGGGAGTALFELLLGPAREAHARSVLGAGRRPVADVVRAELGADAGLVGAGLLALGNASMA